MKKKTTIVKMNKLFILWICLLIISDIKALTLSNDGIHECYIHNYEHKNDYLYVADENLQNKQTDHTQRVVVYPLEYIDDLDLVKWDIKKIDPNDNIFLIQNQNQYLCSTNNHLDFFQMRRKVNLVDLKGDLLYQNKCLWRLEKYNKDSHDYIENKLFKVWNVKYDEPLYAAIKNDNNDTRNVYTWYKPHDSIRFVWQFDCLYN